MADLSRGAAAMRRLRLRRAGLLPVLPDCTACGRQVRSSRTAPLCSRCWRLSDAGREWNRLRMAQRRATDCPEFTPDPEEDDDAFND